MFRPRRNPAKNNAAPAVALSPSGHKRTMWPAYSMAIGFALGLVALAIRLDWFSPTPVAGPVEQLGAVGVNDGAAPGPAPDGMVWIPGGTFWMGQEGEQFADTQPIHKVYVDGFWMDRGEVTNRQFRAFVQATGYVTLAERKPTARGLHSAPFSFVFTAPDTAIDPSKADPMAWWKAVPGADWRHPEGPSSDLTGRGEHPVVHVAYEDALEFCAWANKRLPTEAEWEFAARGGLDRQRFCWGNERNPGGKFLANTWQGPFPSRNTREDGFAGTAPVGSFPPNGFGLFDMAGNVWQWCADWYHPKYYRFSPPRNPQGPLASFDPNEPGVPKRVQRGGSFLCADEYCMRYLPGARGKGEPGSAANHIGFRCARSAGE
jgi:formylglycine-generating enzyme